MKPFSNNNLDYTVNKNNNPYLLIQKAGKTRKTRTRRTRTRRTRRTRRRKKLELDEELIKKTI